MNKAAYKLRTVDIWDTVLRRRCHPDAVKLATARTLIQRHSRLLLPMYRDSWVLLDLRCRIEGELARAAATNPDQDDEYRLRDVLTAWIGRASVMGLEEIESVAQNLGAAELEHEHFVCYADAGIRERLAQHPAERTIFLSDFYMPASDLRSLLAAKGMADLFDGGISSCDYKLNKRSGRLFGLVHQLYKVSPAEHFHIGDNLHSDYVAPRRLAISASHYLHDAEEKLREVRKKVFYSRAELYRWIEHACAADASTGVAKEAAAGRALGIALAPLFVGFAQYILESAQGDGVEKIFFFTREGEFFIKLYEALRSAAPHATQAAPESAVLEVSRLATFAASIGEISTAEMMRLWNLYSIQSMEAWGHSLGLPSAEIAGWCLKHGIPPEQPLRYPWQDTRVQQLFDDPGVRHSLGTFIAEKKSLLVDYLESKGLTADSRKVAIVDIGWRGSIQDNIALLMSRTQFFGYYMGLQKFLNVQPENCIKRAFGPDLNTSSDGGKLFGNLALIEMLTNSPNGSTTGYRRNENGSLSSIRLNEPGEDTVYHNYIQYIQAGILEAAEVWAEYVHTYSISSIELREHAWKLWEQIIASPPALLAKALSELRHNEVFGAGTFVQKGKPRTLLAKKLHWPWK